MVGSSQSAEGKGPAPADLPRLDPTRIRFAQRHPLAGIFYLLMIPASLLVVLFFTALVVNWLDSPGGYATNSAEAGLGGLLSGAIKVCFLAGAAVMCGFLWKQAKASFQANRAERFLSDPKLPVLYLRPFCADSKAGFLDQLPPTNSLGLASPRYVRHLFRTSASSEEGELLQTLEQSGPVLAIGRPGERIPPVGAARVYVEHSEWQDFVRVLTYYARTIFVRVGDTSGFQWELQHLRRDCDPLKILVFFPPTSGRQRNAAVSMVDKELGVSLKEISPLGWVKGMWAGHATPFLFAFNKDWEPILVALSAEKLAFFLKAWLGAQPVPSQCLQDGWAVVHRDLVAAKVQKLSARSTVKHYITKGARRLSQQQPISCIESGCQAPIQKKGRLLGHTFYLCDAGHEFSVGPDGELKRLSLD